MIVGTPQEGLRLLPEHMRASAARWVSEGFPDPERMGSFLRAVLSNDLVGAFAHADSANVVGMQGWAAFLHNHAPDPCWGSIDALWAWHRRFRPGPPAIERVVKGPAGAPITSVRIELNYSPHARLTVWNRGGLAGQLVVDAPDADEIAGRLADVGEARDAPLRSTLGELVTEFLEGKPLTVAPAHLTSSAWSAANKLVLDPDHVSYFSGALTGRVHKNTGEFVSTMRAMRIVATEFERREREEPTS